jgi:hypothetical protein
MLTKLALFWVALRGFGQAAEWASTAVRQTDWAPEVEVEQLKEICISLVV